MLLSFEFSFSIEKKSRNENRHLHRNNFKNQPVRVAFNVPMNEYQKWQCEKSDKQMCVLPIKKFIFTLICPSQRSC